MLHSDTHDYQQEKTRIARNSVAAAVFLTGIKLVVGLWTGSLGILSEAAHSGLDFLAALMTWFSVSVSDRPADETHPYGHQKIDNLSAFLETLLLLATCCWIIYEAIERLFFKSVEIQVNVFSFAVIVVAIIIDYSRGMALSRTAKKTGSAALEADAFHFLSDIASSGVVLAGLVLTKIGYPKADAICSIAVALLVLWISCRLGKKAIDALTDRVPQDHVTEIWRAAMQVPGVNRVYDVRVRHSGNRHFIDMKIGLRRETTLNGAHEITDKIETVLKESFKNADVLVHAEPHAAEPAGLTEAAFTLAQQYGVNVHSIQVHQAVSGMYCTMHLEWPSDTNLGEAHRKATELEERLKQRFPRIVSIRSHLECCDEESTVHRNDVTSVNSDFIKTIRIMTRHIAGVRDIRDVQIMESDGRWYVSLTCIVDSGFLLREAHQIATDIETRICTSSPHICSVHVHTEPVQ